MSFFDGISGVKTKTTIRAEVGGVKVTFRREGVLEGSLDEMAAQVARGGKLTATVDGGQVAGAVDGAVRRESHEGSGAAARSMLLRIKAPVPADPTEPDAAVAPPARNGKRVTVPA